MARLIAVGIAMLFLVVLFFLWRRPAPQSLPADDRVAVTRNTSSATAEEPRPEKIPQKLPARSIAPVVSNPPEPEQREEMESQDDQTKRIIEASRPKKGGPLEILKRTYEDESRDANATEVEKLIREQFGDEYLPVEFLHNVTCHEKVCKAQMYWTEKNPLVVMAFAMKIGRLLTGNIASDPESEPDRQGRVLVTLYILRDGELSDL